MNNLFEQTIEENFRLVHLQALQLQYILTNQWANSLTQQMGYYVALVDTKMDAEKFNQWYNTWILSDMDPLASFLLQNSYQAVNWDEVNTFVQMDVETLAKAIQELEKSEGNNRKRGR